MERKMARPLGLTLPLVVLCKFYTIIILWLLFSKVHFATTYSPYVFVGEGRTRDARLREVEARFFERLAPFDGQWYLDIAYHGYRRITPADAETDDVPGSNLAFFPLFPIVLRGAIAAGLDPVQVGIIVNVLLSVLGLVGLAAIARALRINPVSTVILAAAFPGALFQSLLYTEALFLCLTVATYLLSRRGATGLACVTALLCGMCRPQGVLVSLLVFRDSNWESGKSRSRLRQSAVVCMPFVGLAVVCVVDYLAVADAFAFLRIQSDWDRRFGLETLFHGLIRVFDFLTIRDVRSIVDGASVLLAIGVLPYIYRKLPRPFFFFILASIALPLSTGRVISMGRFLSVCFPVFLSLAAILESRPFVYWSIVTAMVLLQVMLASRAIAWHFVG